MSVDPDFGLTAEDYATHRADFPARTFSQLAQLGIGLAGQDVLDLGTGTGTFARQFARQGCEVTGLDPSPAMLQAAQDLAEQQSLTVRWREAHAEDSGLDSASFDVVTAAQCWHWFDVERVAAEVHRLLRPGGRVVIAQFDWLPLPGSLVEAVEQLILKFSPQWHLGGGTGLYPERFAHLAVAGFTSLESFSFDVDVPYTRASWRGRIRASAGVGGSLSDQGVRAFDAEHAELLDRFLDSDACPIPHRVFVMHAMRA